MNPSSWNNPFFDLALLIVITVLIVSLIAFFKIFRSLKRIAHDKEVIEIKLRASELRYRAFFEAAPYAGMVWTEGFIITDWNLQAERVFGWKREEVLGRCGFDFLVSASDEAAIKKTMCHLQRQSLATHLISNNLTRDGRTLTCEWFHVWLDATSLHGVEIISLGLDISERLQTEAALASTLANVEKAEAEQRHLLSVASHEFRTPAAMIKASLDSLAFLKDSIAPEVALRLDNIRQASGRLISLANHLISEDRVQEMILRPQMRSIDLCKLVSEVVSRYPVAEKLQCQLPEHPVLLSTDPALLAVAIHNLIDNALRINVQLGLPVMVSVIESGDIVEIQVADLGPGVPESEQEAIFQRFHSAKGGNSDGLGLSIVYSVARAHGGIAFVYDNQPHGAVFVIQLPGSYQGQISF